MSLPVEHPTLIRRLAEAGFVSAVQGKWHVTDVEPPEEFGCDDYLPTPIDQVIRESFETVDFIIANADQRFYLELNTMQTHRDLVGEFSMEPGFKVDEADGTPPEYWGLPDWPEIRRKAIYRGTCPGTTADLRMS
jgi:arylsulfatase A-like enzyme